MMTLNTKIVLHIPLVAWKDHAITPIDYAAFKHLLLVALEDAGASSLYTVQATGYYKGREYAETLWTIFCEETDRDRIVEAFRRTFREHNDIMQQEAFAYECNGTLHVEEL